MEYMNDMPIIDEQPPPPAPSFDITQILGLLSKMNSGGNDIGGGNGTAPSAQTASVPFASPAADLSGILGMLSNGSNFNGNSNPNSVQNDLLKKFLLNGGLQKLFTPKPQKPEPVRTINLENYRRID
jgi:hypothetical protein